MGMVFRDAAARPALKPTATRALPLRGEGVESPSSWRELKPSLREGVASLLARGGRTGPDGPPPGFPTTTLTARRNPAQADNGWTAQHHRPPGQCHHSSEERRVGKACGSPGRSRCPPEP